jgi:hypothetical protein
MEHQSDTIQCFHCPERATFKEKRRLSFLDSTSKDPYFRKKKLVKIYKCKCGEISWLPADLENNAFVVC